MKKPFIDFLFETTQYDGLTFPFLAGAYQKLHKNNLPIDSNYIMDILNDIVENSNSYYIIEECHGISQLVIKQLEDDYNHKQSIRHYRINNKFEHPIIYFEEHFTAMDTSIADVCKKIIDKYPDDCFSKGKYSINFGKWSSFSVHEEQWIEQAILNFLAQ